MIVLVCGSRKWRDIHAIRMRLLKLPPDCEIIHGAARGADMIAAALATDFGFTVRAFPADWDRHGKAAGPIRNLAMLDERPDLVVAFQVGESSGTQHTINEARKRGIPVEVHRNQGEPMSPKPKTQPPEPVPEEDTPVPASPEPPPEPMAPEPPTSPQPPPS